MRVTYADPHFDSDSNAQINTRYDEQHSCNGQLTCPRVTLQVFKWIYESHINKVKGQYVSNQKSVYIIHGGTTKQAKQDQLTML